MGLTDVFARWVLGKVDEELLKKKKWTVEERIRTIHDDLPKINEYCKEVASLLRSSLRNVEELPREPGPSEPGRTLSSFFNRKKDMSREDCWDLRRLRKGALRAFRDIDQHLPQLDFYLKREGFPELANVIFDCIHSVFWAGSVEKKLPALWKAGIKKDEREVQRLYELLSDTRRDLESEMEFFDQATEGLLAFAKAMNK